MKRKILVLLAVLLTALIMTGCFSGPAPKFHDYTGRAENIESISYIEITRLEYGKTSDVFEYKVLETIDEESKDDILRDLSGLEYTFRPEPLDLEKGSHGILLCFKEDTDDVRYAFYSRKIFVVVDKTETGFDIDKTYGNTPKDNWILFLDRYLKNDHGFDESDR